MWQPDETATVCSSCGSGFSIFVRRHHCRFCGKIYCDACTLHRAFVPSFIQTMPVNSRVRLCSSCFSVCEDTSRVEPLLRVLSLLPIPIRVMYKLLLNKEWAHAVNTIIRVYRKIPSKLPFERYSRLETQLLRSQSPFLVGHVPWQIQRARCLQVKPNEKVRILPCTFVGCPHTCTGMNGSHVLQLLNFKHLLRVRDIYEWIGDKIFKFSASDLVLFMTFLRNRT